MFQTLGWPGRGTTVTVTVTATVRSSSRVPPTGFSLSADLGTIYSFIFTEYDQDPEVLSSSCEGLTILNKIGKVELETPSYYCDCSLKRSTGRPRDFLGRPQPLAIATDNPEIWVRLCRTEAEFLRFNVSLTKYQCDSRRRVSTLYEY